MAAKKTSSGKLFKISEGGAVSGSKAQRLYTGHVGGFNVGTVVAANKTAGRKKLLTLARKLLK